MTINNTIPSTSVPLSGQLNTLTSKMSSSPGNQQARETNLDAEAQLRQIWATVLNLDSSSLGPDDNFFDLGGDSIDAMRVVSKARKIGLAKLRVVDLYNHASLREAACWISSTATEGNASKNAPSTTIKEHPNVKKAVTVEQDGYHFLDGQPGLLRFTDGQVAVHGRDVHIGEVRSALSSQRHVKEAIVGVQHMEGQEPRLVGLVTLNEMGASTVDAELREQQEAQQVDVWKGIYDDEAYTNIDEVQSETIGRDFIGWNSMFDGTPIDKTDMEEWLDDTIGTILNGKPPGRFLEIGSGSGMILFNLGQDFENYIGVEPSLRAVQFINKAAASIPALSGKVKMYNASAGDIHKITEDMAPDTIIVNSVAQYFPSQDYLLKVIKGMVRLNGVKTIFFGDIRSYAQYRDFLAARALHMLGDQVSPEEVRAVMAQLELSETEFLIDPAFFTALEDQMSEYIEHVEILPKTMHATNELSCYRYAAVLYLKQQGQTLQVRDVDSNQWVDFKEEGLSRQSLLQHLQQPSTSPIVAIANIPHSKTMFERIIVDTLGNNTQQLTSDAWLSSIRERALAQSSLSVVDLKSLAKETGYRVETSWARQFGQRGGLDAIFYRSEDLDSQGRVLFKFPTEHQSRPNSHLSTEPLRQHFRRNVQEQLRETMKNQLPLHMIPDKIVVLDKMPTLKSDLSDHSITNGS